MASFEQGSKRERQKTVERQMILEKAIREEHEATRVIDAATLTKRLDRVNHDVVALVSEEQPAPGARPRRANCAGRSRRRSRSYTTPTARRRTSVWKVKRRRAVRAQDGDCRGARDRHATRPQGPVDRGIVGMEPIAAGRVEPPAVRTAVQVKPRRLAATEGRVEVEVAALRKLYARQTALELDLDAFKRDVVRAFGDMQDEVTVAAVRRRSTPRRTTCRRST